MSHPLDEVVGVATVANGRLHIRQRRQFDALVRMLDDRGTYEVTVRRLRATRSSQANRYYWGVVIALLAEHTGYTPEEMHEACKQLFVPKQLDLCSAEGEVVHTTTMGGRTATLTTAQFTAYVDQVRRWAAEELGVETPDPQSLQDAP